MSDDVRVQTSFSLKRAVAKDIMNLPLVARKVHNTAERIAATANGMYDASGYGVSDGTHGNRAHSFVYTGDMHTIKSQHAHSTLQKALHG